MKNKKIILPLGIVILTTLLIVTYFFIFSNKELKIMKIDGEDSSYIIENVEQNDEFKINTDSINYSITDIQGKKIKTDNKLDNHVLTMKAKAQYQDNIIYKIELNKGDSFVDEKLKDAKKIYFAINNKEFSKNDLKYEVLSTNLKNQYTLKDKKLKLDKLIIKLKIKTLNKEVTIKPSKYKLFIDNKEQSLNLIKSSKGKHTIKIQFNYDGKRYDYSKKVNFKEVSIDKLAKSIYKKLLESGKYGNIKINKDCSYGVIDLNSDGISDLIVQEYLEGCYMRISIYSVYDNHLYKAYQRKEFNGMSTKVLKDKRVYIYHHFTSTDNFIYLLKFMTSNGKLKLNSCEEYEASYFSEKDNATLEGYTDNDGKLYTREQFFKRHNIVFDKNFNELY